MSSRQLRAVSDGLVTLVDSCVLLDILTDDPAWADWSDDALAAARDAGATVINPIIYAEVAGGFETIEDLDAALPESELERLDLPYQAGFVASKAFVAYRRRGGERKNPLPDFYIGAHAAVAGYRLLTRDVSRFTTYFPGLELISPEP
ncbi:type II toxin-antitoxin system VapC family toxin [Nocardia terpenica]|uniref:type II toxin-antitoxin system VapC family toxin n=1 Tax=Nocardia terpenica TaxID=455432 RepID=UPI001932CE56|nr:type II toxin-antitoxin system VapC family toxin [Nocardia terpenica]